ncbi:MAG: RpiB/LacA/LacB family sugar-phosphate isomerase [Candidatus Magasanikbacteria bacterium]|nr:RpiB/LacA/LacB family sugar-phosphate isomerase [Candidatus Magasanikbacteria bacterium]
MLYIAADHGGYQLKKYLIRYLKTQLKVTAKDLGAKSHDPKDDYPDFAVDLARQVVKNKTNQGILLCRNGIGVCITANKIKGIRAALGFNIEATEWARRDDHVNILCLPAEYLSNEHAAAIVKKFLETPDDMDERFTRRLKKIAAVEK